LCSVVLAQILVLAEFFGPWFSTPWIALFDTLRMALILGDLVLIWMLMHAVFLAPTPAARYLLIAFVCAVFLSLETQVERLGDDPLSWRFFFVFAETLFGLYGAWRYVYRGEAVAYVFRRRRDGDNS
jgi:hypothetical protein